MIFVISAFVTPNHASEGLIASSELIIFYEKLDCFIKFFIGIVKTIIIAFNLIFIHIEIHLPF